MTAPDAPSAIPGMFAPRPGTGTRITANALGYVLSASRRGTSFGHPWKPMLSGGGVRLTRGYIIDTQGGKAIEPRINGVRISGEPGKAQPTLRLDPKIVNDQGESWVCVEVEPDREGVITGPESVRIVQGSEPKFSGRVEVGREPLALIVWQGGFPRLVEAIAMYHLKYVHWRPPAGAGDVRHFFV